MATPGADEASRPLGSGRSVCLLPLNYPAAPPQAYEATGDVRDGLGAH